MLDEYIRLADALNHLSRGQLNAGHAEAQIRLGHPHHVDGEPLRIALAKIRPDDPDLLPTRWSLLFPRPGRLAGLTGPADLIADALDFEMVVISNQGQAWLGQMIGHGVQWTIRDAQPPHPPVTLNEASPKLLDGIHQAESALASVSLIGSRPIELVKAPVLGACYSKRNQEALDRAYQVHQICQTGIAESHRALSSHSVELAEKQLRELDLLALETISAAVSWPTVFNQVG